jgi:hypothetical protein
LALRFPAGSRSVNGILARSVRLWELPNAEAANPASAWRGSKPHRQSRDKGLLPQRTTDSSRIILFDQFQFALPPDWNPIILLRKVGIGPVGADH